MLTREEAIQQLIDRDVAKWGEAERAASTEMRKRLSHALALNALAHYDINAIDRAMAKEAKAIMTKEDRRQLRHGG